MSKLLTVKQAAQYFRVCEMSVRRWEASGDLRSVRFGRSIRFTQDSLSEFAKQHENKNRRSPMSNTEYKPSGENFSTHPTPAPVDPASTRTSTEGRTAAEVWLFEAQIVECDPI